MLIHEALLATPQVQPDPQVTLTEPVPAAGVKKLLVGEMVYVQAWPCWVTVKVWPPMMRVPVRAVMVVLADTE
jgi:hypothetical protein